ncbi:MAG: signal recognition particle subunit SRP19/SEC65 family protein [Candidatus Lokiarchaeota archaeon]|nr:signal recognition particle subunit SRP19/SEC65 family protein [Candidatus Lokiarchaeota archaeon]
MRKRTPYLIFWPQYFDKNRTINQGRRLPKNLAIEKVTLDDIEKAVKALGYEYKIENTSRYPKTWWDNPGRILIDSKGKKKRKILFEIAKQIRKIKS